jgi:polysulfide reductase chain C
MPLLQSADWPLIIDIYFFFGGLAGGAFVIATVASLWGGERNREIARIGYYLALLAIIPGPIILIVDLGMPTRFLHMMMVAKPELTIGQSAINIGPFHLKPFSPMNAGSWALMGFSLCAFLAALDVFLVDRGGRSMATLRQVVGIIGGFFGFFIAAYPGVLMGATARPLWIDARLLGALFLTVGMTTGGAAIALVLAATGARAREGLASLKRTYTIALGLELVILILLFAIVRGAGPVAQAGLAALISGVYGTTFWLGAVGVGLIIPLILELTSRRRVSMGVTAISAILILIGGFLTKYVIMVAGQAI